MSKSRIEPKTLVDFSELSRDGAGLEGLARLLGLSLGLEVEWTGIGPDGGKDLIFKDLEKGHLGSTSFKWLVQCKDFSESNKTVGDSDVPSILDKVEQHKCNGFLLIVTTRVSAGLTLRMSSLKLKTQVWDQYELTQLLLQPQNDLLLLQFFPTSYSKIQNYKKASSESLNAFRSVSEADIGDDKEDRDWIAVSVNDLSVPGTAIEVSYPVFNSKIASDIREVNLILEAFSINQIHGIRQEDLRDYQPFRGLLEKEEPDSVYLSEFEVYNSSSYFLSVVFDITTFSKGLAHPNNFTKTFNFQFGPCVELPIDTILEKGWLKVVSNICRNAIQREIDNRSTLDDLSDNDMEEVIRFIDSDKTDSKRDYSKQLLEGTSAKLENFQKYYLLENSFVFIFDQYSVADYAWGAFKVEIPFIELSEYISKASMVTTSLQAYWHNLYGDVEFDEN